MKITETISPKIKFLNFLSIFLIVNILLFSNNLFAISGSSPANCGKAIELDGNNDFVNIPDLNLARDSDFTIEGWVKLAPGIDYKDGLFGDGFYTHLNFTAGKPRFSAYGVRMTATTEIPADTWAHIAVTRSLGSNLTMYINGVEDASGIFSGSLKIKFLGKGYRGFFQGKMDEMRIWNTTRTATEINGSYNTSVDPNTSGLIGYWTFNETDQIITDASTSGNHGSLGISPAVGNDDPTRVDSMVPLAENCGDGGGGGNISPVAKNDSVTPILAGEDIIIDVLANDSDFDGTINKTSLSIVSLPSAGSVDLNDVTGEITYTHDGSATTSDSFIYTVEDDEGEVSNEATVFITITNPSASCGKGIELDGNNDFINIPDLTLTGDFTLEGWVKLAPGIDHKDGLFGDGAYTHLNFSSGKPRLDAYGVRITATTAISADTWAHIAVTRSASNLTMYINGVEDASAIYARSLKIKVLGKGYRGYFKGKMDEIRIWNISRTAAEISDTYNTSVDPNSSGLISYWTFNEIDQVILDSSNSSNHGSLGISSVVGTDDPVRVVSMVPLIEGCGGEGGNITPIAKNDTVAPILAGGTITIDVLANDRDIDGTLNQTSLLFVSPPSSGSVVIDDVTGEITYTHDGSATTSDSFIYSVEDDEGATSNEASVFITITDPDPDLSCGKGIELDGINDWVNIPNLSLASDFTIESWVKLAPGIDNRDSLFGQEGFGPDINFYQGKARLYAFGDRVTANTALLPNTWTHLARVLI